MSTEEWKIATLQLRLLTKHIRYKINQVECFFFGAVISQFFSKMIYQFINDNDGAEAIKKSIEDHLFNNKTELFGTNST